MYGGALAGRLVAAAGFLSVAACASNVADNGTNSAGEDGALRADLTILIARPYADSVSYGLVCGPAGASLEGDPEIDPARACSALSEAAVRQRLLEGPPAERACTLIYGGPEQAFITGTLDGAPVDARVSRDDGCGIADWEQLLADLLVAVGEGDR